MTLSEKMPPPRVIQVYELHIVLVNIRGIMFDTEIVPTMKSTKHLGILHS